MTGEGRTLPIILQALKQDRRANAGREGTTRAHRSSWSCPRPMTPAVPIGVGVVIDEIVREGARRMLAEALQAEVDAYIAQFLDERDERGADWWCATAPTSPARSSPAQARSR